MKKTILILMLLFSANAFAEPYKSRFVWSDKCVDGNCTRSEIEAVNRENYQNHLIHIQNIEAEDAEDERKWVEEHREAQARADALPVIKKEPGQTYETCASRVYEKASEIIGDNAKNYITVTSDVENLDNCQVTFDVKTHGKACEYFGELSAIAKPHYTTAEYCRFLAEEMEVLKDYRDRNSGPAFTQSVQRERDSRLKPIYKRHDENVKKLFDTWEQQQKQNQK